MSKLIALRGLPGSGKTTIRNELLSQPGDRPITYVNKDEIRTDPRFHTEKMVHREWNDRVVRHLKQGWDVISDNTHLTASSVSQLERIASFTGSELEWIDLTQTVDLWTCIERDELRRLSGDRYVGRSVIIRMAMQNGLYEHHGPKSVVVFDLDGTLCDIRHRRHYVQSDKKDWNSFYAGIPFDTPNPHVDLLYRMTVEYGTHHILFVSGRPERYRRMSEDWLRQYGYNDYFALFMRPSRDGRADYIVKEEIYHELIEPWFEVDMVVDDRQQVVDMWRNNLGKYVLQAAPGDF